MKLTSEQKVITNHLFCPGERIRIKAFAGTGKTSVLVEIAKRNSDLGFLYICYNKSVQTEAQIRFPSNTQCRTGHSLAFGAVGRSYIKKLAGRIRAKQVKHYFGDPDMPYDVIVPALETIVRWCSTADGDIGPDHVPNAETLEDDVLGPIIITAKKIWEEMRKPEKGLPMTHDGYLKLWQLSHPDLSKWHVILLDEAQDANPALVDILSRQRCGLVFVGDPHQAIYQWRGAVNAMEEIPCDRTYTITRSFRFGKSVADLATKLLSETKGEENAVEGRGPATEIRAVKEQETRTVLCRTNVGLFEVAMDCYHQGVGVSFVGGIDSYDFQNILDVGALFEKQSSQIKSWYLRSFQSFSHLEGLSYKTKDQDMLRACSLIKRNGVSLIREMVATLKANSAPRGSKITLTTAHKAKGLEWPNVVLYEDFPDFRRGVDPQEYNLFYVAMTRARKALQINSQLQSYISVGLLSEEKTAPETLS